MKFKCISSHPEDLAGGRVVGPGEVVELSRGQTEEDHNSRLIAEGKFLGLSRAAENIVNETTDKEGDSA